MTFANLATERESGPVLPPEWTRTRKHLITLTLANKTGTARYPYRQGACKLVRVGLSAVGRSEVSTDSVKLCDLDWFHHFGWLGYRDAIATRRGVPRAPIPDVPTNTKGRLADKFKPPFRRAARFGMTLEWRK